MSIFSIVDTVQAEISALALQRRADQQAMVAEVEALLGKLAKPAEVAPKPRRARKPKAEAMKLNAVGKPYSPQYDPKYRMKYRTPKLISGCAGHSSAASNAVKTYYRAAIEAKYPGNTALVNEICARNGA